MIILAGDIGGTKTILALYEYVDGVLEYKSEQEFASQNYLSFSEVLDEYIAHNVVQKIDALCFGVAGPIINGACKTTNLPWHIETVVLQEQLSVKNVYLLNDLEATAYGMLYLKEEEFVDVNFKGQELKANCAVIAAGTGLGEGMLFYDGKNYHPIGSEGGHSDFAPLNARQDELLVWMRNRYPEHVSIERLVCGDGIYTIYEFLKESYTGSESALMVQLSENDDRNAMVSHCALHENDPLCVQTMQLFVEIYGAEAGNLALKSLSLGGVYIGGGIAPKILPFLLDGIFLNAFISKGRFKEMLENMKVKIALNPKTALLGAAHFGLDKLL